MKPEVIEQQDFYYNEQGYMVFKAGYLLERGECCGNGCKHCPYQYKNVAEPLRSKLIALSNPSP